MPPPARTFRNRFFLIFFFLSVYVLPACAAADLKIHFLDVGEGDAIFIQTPSGKTVLVDSGNLITGYKVWRYLKDNKVTTLDYVIFTHPHPDHIGGSFLILQMFKAKRVFDNGQPIKQLFAGQDLYRWYNELVREHPGYEVLCVGRAFSIDGVSFKVVWPPRSLIFENFNSNSLVMMVKYKDFSCLLTGDLDIPAETSLLAAGVDLKAYCLKVGHHGGRDSLCEGFAAAVNPKISIISVAASRASKMLSYASLKLLADMGSKIYRTDKDGDIILMVDRKGRVRVESRK